MRCPSSLLLTMCMLCALWRQVDEEALVTLVRLLKLSQPISKGQLQRLFHNLCANSKVGPRWILITVLMNDKHLIVLWGAVQGRGQGRSWAGTCLAWGPDCAALCDSSLASLLDWGAAMAWRLQRGGQQGPWPQASCGASCGPLRPPATPPR
jgi:hypothetical protein